MVARLFVWCGSSLRFLGREICELKHSSISCYRRQFLKLRGYPYWNPVLETVDKSFSSTLGKSEGLRILLIHSASSIPRLAESHRVQCKDRFWTRPLSSASKTYEENLPPLSSFSLEIFSSQLNSKILYFPNTPTTNPFTDQPFKKYPNSTQSPSERFPYY